jgi:hypothetical protein
MVTQPEVMGADMPPVQGDLEQDLAERFAPERIGRLCTQLMQEGLGFDATAMLGERQFLVAYIDADSEFADIPRSTETTVFAKAFKLSLSEVYLDYGAYDSASTFAAVIDMKAETPAAAGALRITRPSEKGFKDVNDLVVDDPSNPWIEEIKAGYFKPGEAYDPAVAWQRLAAAEGVDLKLEDSLDIATHASAEAYSGAHGDINGVSMLFYHACLRYALAHGQDNLLAIFDIPPFENLQQFGNPFDTYGRLQPHPYGGPYDTIPAFCVIERGMRRISDKNAYVGSVFAGGTDLDKAALMPNEYTETYSNEAIGL